MKNIKCIFGSHEWEIKWSSPIHGTHYFFGTETYSEDGIAHYKVCKRCGAETAEAVYIDITRPLSVDYIKTFIK